MVRLSRAGHIDLRYEEDLNDRFVVRRKGYAISDARLGLLVPTTLPQVPVANREQCRDISLK